MEEERSQYMQVMLSNIGKTMNNFFIELCLTLLPLVFSLKNCIIRYKFIINPAIDNTKKTTGIFGSYECPIIVWQSANSKLSFASVQLKNEKSIDIFYNYK